MSHGYKFTLHTAMELIQKYPAVMHSPYYTNPCSDACPVCNMDKDMYDKAKAIKIVNRRNNADVN